ncbi:MAG: hypothetical protein IBJ15_23690, partial [Alphaproteobacteria bacterium]|nr:hypothetical protein [Alphaproteobacteria bacterium]
MKSMNARVAGLTGALMLAVTLGSAPAWAGKPEWVEDGKGGKDRKHDRAAKHGGKAGRDDHRGDDRPQARPSSGPSVNIQIGAYFGDSQRQIARDYYGSQFRSGHCPPGLAKKNNGCMPPGQAKKWRVGYRLPGDVVYYPVPNEVVVRLGVPPAGHK